jgi:hypothetical protein
MKHVLATPLKPHYYRVFLKEKPIFNGGTIWDCLTFLDITYTGITVKELIDDGIQIR